jgi:alcohol dehydrogenase
VDQQVRSMVLEAPGRLVMREFDRPRTSQDDALLKVDMAGICHTDVGLYHGSVSYALPLILGHEIVGRIAEIGPVARARWGVCEGDRVVVEPMVRCGFCPACVAGHYRFCVERIGYGTFVSSAREPHLWGSYGEYMYLAPGSVVHSIPETLTAGLATLSMVAVSNAVRWTDVQGGVRPGDAVVVQGVGPIGLSCIAVAKEMGAYPVIATGLRSDRERLCLAREFGADHTVDVESEDVVERVRELTAGRLADVVVDVTGSGSAVCISLDLVRTMGTVVSAGVTGDATRTALPLDKILYKEIRLQGAFTFDSDAVRRALMMVQNHRYPFERMISHSFPLERAEEAIRTAGREIPSEREPIKVVISINS